MLELRHVGDEARKVGCADELREHRRVVLLDEAGIGHGAAQVFLRFERQEGAIIFPKSTNPGRIKSNMDIFNFTLTDEEMDAMRALDKGKGSHDPDAPGVAEFLISAFDVHAND